MATQPVAFKLDIRVPLVELNLYQRYSANVFS